MKIIKKIPERIINLAILALGVLNIIVGVNLYKYSNNLDTFEFAALNIGQGDSLLIKTPNNYYGLIDAGKGTYILEELVETLPFGKRELAFIIATHHDADHIEGLLEVLKRYKVKTLLVNKSVESKPLSQELINIIREEDIETYSIDSSNDFEIDNVRFDVVWPLERTEAIVKASEVEENDNSIGLIISYKDLDIYSAGDLSTEFEIESIKNYENIDIDILKASHHGSKTSSGIEFLRLIKPEYTIISAGLNNSYGHPHQEVLENLQFINSQILRTDINGRIQLKYLPNAGQGKDSIEIIAEYQE